MAKVVAETINEVDFCAQVTSAANSAFEKNPESFPFSEARVEGYGTGSAKRKRKDLRFFGQNGRLVLCGEVKLPGTKEGRSPYDEGLIRDASHKAEDAGVQFFFTWNVNGFVLWDRGQWDRPLLERRVKEWRLGRTLKNAEEVARPHNLQFILDGFLPDLLRDLADIVSGRRRDWFMPPDDIFIRSLESHLDWPVQLTTSYLIEQCEKNKAFDAKVQSWLAKQDWVFVRRDPDEWESALTNMAKTLSYVWANRLIFYKALRARFPELPALELKRSVKTESDAVNAFNHLFELAVERSGDYEPLLFPETKDWATQLVFRADFALDAWRGLLRGIESVNFRDVSSDIVGRIFQKLIGPEERHRYGQHFTGDDVVDLINAFCIHDPWDKVMDPACGSGSFLVRAYYRKRCLDPKRAHADLLGDLFGCDIALYPAHLATLNLAAREINEEANYPRIVRRDFFDTDPAEPFCTLPDAVHNHSDIMLPRLDAIVGNPPYVRQEKIDQKDKPAYSAKVTKAWPDLKLTGRADLHCYFWPVATAMLREGGYFGFLTSSSWLDVEYGFALQGWILRHFKLLVVMESAAEPWFADARVKTVATIIQRCNSENERMNTIARFVRFKKPLADIIGVAPGKEESERQRAVERLRDRILSATQDEEDEALRIVVRPQHELWNEGVRAGSVLRNVENETGVEESEVDAELGGDEAAIASEHLIDIPQGDYVAGKWGRYIRAPHFYFEIMRRFGDRFAPLGEIATIRRGITSGCDAFFMPKDVTGKLLAECRTDREFKTRSGGAARRAVENGELRIIEAGDGSFHPIEAQYLAPEVHSLMKVDRPIVRANDLDRVVLLVSDDLKNLRGTWVHRYLKYGETADFASKKSKGVPVPERSTCAAREPWYDLTKLVKPGFAFWPMAQQYRHVIAGNPERLICNHNLFDLFSDDLSQEEQNALWAILNSTLIGLFKTFYGRFAGTEGNLKTEVVDVNLLDIPNPKGIQSKHASKLLTAVEGLCRRPFGRLVEQQLMECHSIQRARKLAEGPLVLPDELKHGDRRALDDAVFEMLGVANAAERKQLVDRLYEETAMHFRAIRVVEIEKMEQRSKSGGSQFTVEELAADAWDAAELPDATPLAEWIGTQPECCGALDIPEERPASMTPSPMFDPNAVYFGKRHQSQVDCQSLGQAKLVFALGDAGVSGMVRVAATNDECEAVLARLAARMTEAEKRFTELAESRTSDEHTQGQIVSLLMRWFAVGRNPKRATDHPN